MGDHTPEDLRRLSIASVASTPNPENPDRFFSCEPDTPEQDTPEQDTPNTMSQNGAATSVVVTPTQDTMQQSRATSPPIAVQELRKSLNLSDPAQMLIIDKLRELNIRCVIALPQLVVVGDQSSGKSSVLEAIMEFPLPRKSGLCTRFATNIVLNRSQTTGVRVSIVAGPKTEEKTKLKFEKWGEEKEKENIKNLDGQTFLKVLSEASETMGLMGHNETRTKSNKAFSDAILKIELSGPEYDNLSIIDLPGIFHALTKDHTTKEDKDFVKEMVRWYIKDERTIILAVLGSNSDLANQEILDIAKEADPKSLRTLGVLTKPDLVDKGDEFNIIDLIAGKRNKLALGYSIVCNRCQDELNFGSSTRARNDKESEFFATSPWNRIDRDRVGIDSLKSRLQVLLAEMINREFPKMKLEIDNGLTEAQRSLAELGIDRGSAEQQRRFLEGIAMRFQAVKADTLDKMYWRHDILTDDQSLRLPTLIAKEFDSLVKEFKKHGEVVEFEDGEESEDEGTCFRDDDDNDTAKGTSASGDARTSSEEADILKVKDTTYPELEGITIATRAYKTPPETNAKDWIEREYRAVRGYDLDVMNANILPLLWRTQSATWPSITKKFMDKIIVTIHRHIHGLLSRLCPSERIFNDLRDFLMDEILERYRTALHHVELIIKVERQGALITKNHYFADTLSKIRNKAAEARLRAMAIPTQDKSQFVNLEDLLEPQTYKSNLKQAVDDLHSVLMVYHKVARKRVIDNIIQNVDYFLLSGENSPLNILTPVYISGLKNEDLKKIADEDMVSKNKREGLTNLISQLQQGRRVIRGA